METLEYKHLDLSYLAQMTGGDKNFEEELLNDIKKQLEESIDEIKKSLANNDLERVRALAHKLKSSVNIFGMKEMRDIFKDIEMSIKENRDLDKIPALVDLLSEKYVECRKELEQALKNHYLN